MTDEWLAAIRADLGATHQKHARLWSHALELLGEVDRLRAERFELRADRPSRSEPLCRRHDYYGLVACPFCERDELRIEVDRLRAAASELLPRDINLKVTVPMVIKGETLNAHGRPAATYRRPGPDDLATISLHEAKQMVIAERERCAKIVEDFLRYQDFREGLMLPIENPVKKIRSGE